MDTLAFAGTSLIAASTAGISLCFAAIIILTFYGTSSVSGRSPLQLDRRWRYYRAVPVLLFLLSLLCVTYIADLQRWIEPDCSVLVYLVILIPLPMLYLELIAAKHNNLLGITANYSRVDIRSTRWPARPWLLRQEQIALFAIAADKERPTRRLLRRVCQAILLLSSALWVYLLTPAILKPVRSAYRKDEPYSDTDRQNQLLIDIAYAVTVWLIPTTALLCLFLPPSVSSALLILTPCLLIFVMIMTYRLLIGFNRWFLLFYAFILPALLGVALLLPPVFALSEGHQNAHFYPIAAILAIPVVLIWEFHHRDSQSSSYQAFHVGTKNLPTITLHRAGNLIVGPATALAIIKEEMDRLESKDPDAFSDARIASLRDLVDSGRIALSILSYEFREMRVASSPGRNSNKNKDIVQISDVINLFKNRALDPIRPSFRSRTKRLPVIAVRGTEYGTLGVLTDRRELESCLSNLIANAREAMGSLWSPDQSRRPAYLILSIDFEPRKWFPLKISIENAGDPISDRVRTRMFELFFTTKSKGTGVGLFEVNTFMASHDGFVDHKHFVDPDYGALNQFRLLFPPEVVIADRDQSPRSRGDRPIDRQGATL